MKIRFLVSFLIFSFLLNAAGIVFFILYLNERAHSRTSRKQKAALEQKLSMVTSGAAISSGLGLESVQTRLFAGLKDGKLDYYAFKPPLGADGVLDYTLVVYLHGMGSNHMEPFLIPANSTIAASLSQGQPYLGLLSPSYRKEASWGNDAALSDIVQNIREVLQEYPFKKIVIMGTSMGGCVALNFAALAPEDIKSKIQGVVSVEGAGDLKELFYNTHTDALRPAMMIAFGGTPKEAGETYKQKSFLSNLDRLDPACRIYIISAKQDRVVPPELQKQIVSKLDERKIANRLEELDQTHEAPPAINYRKGLDFVLGLSP